MYICACVAPLAAPQNLSVEILSTTSIRLLWKPPTEELINGVLRHYSIEVESINHSAVTHFDITDHTTMETQIHGLHPNYLYLCTVSASTVAEGPAANITVTMPTDGK